MELQLGLALSTSPVKGFDLNKYVYEPRETVGSDTWSHDGCLGKNKRGFRDAFEMISPVARTLPLLLWNDKPNDGDDRKSLERSSSCTINESDGDGDSIVGWPPIEAWRKKKLHNQFQRRGPNSMYVKVRMEGEAIGRKVDLSLHSSYQTLITTLIGMFGKYQRSVKGTKEGAGYTLTYQDKEGDWLLVGDVPWETFIGSVQRLKIQRSEG